MGHLRLHRPTLEPGGHPMSRRKNPAAVALGRKGGRAKVPKGFSALAAVDRRRIALLGVKARKALRFSSGSAFHSLK
jgi:hypothetical protein